MKSNHDIHNYKIQMNQVQSISTKQRNDSNHLIAFVRPRRSQHISMYILEQTIARQIFEVGYLFCGHAIWSHRRRRIYSNVTLIVVAENV